MKSTTETDKMPTIVDVEAAAVIIVTKAEALESQVMALEIHSAAELAIVTKIQTDQLKPLLKKAEEERAMFSTTLRRMATAWDAKFKPGIDMLKGLMAYADQLVIDWTRAEQKRARLLQEKLNKEAAEAQKLIDEAGISAQIPEVLPALAPKVETSHKVEGGGRIAVTQRREVEIFDEALIPREYLIPDKVRIRHDALENIKIPGVKIVLVDGIRH